MGVQLATLEDLKKSQELVDLYRDYLTRESLTGVITDFSESFVYLSLFDDSGLANGIAVCFIADVTRIRWRGNERLSIQQLVQVQKSTATAPSIDLRSLMAVIESIQTVFGYVNVLTERMHDDITFIGEVEAMDEQALVLHEYGTMATRARSQLLLRMDDISRIDADAAYERSIHTLFSSTTGQSSK